MKKQPSISQAQAISKLEHYCAYQERCQSEVLKKMNDLNVSAQIRNAVLAHLSKKNFLNESRFAIAFARGKFRLKHWGRHKIAIELKARKIGEKDIQKALKELDEPVYQKALHTLAKKWWSQSREKDLIKRKPKLAAYLIGRGWEHDLVYDMLKDTEL